MAWTIGTAQGTNPTTYLATNGTTTLSVVVSAATINLIPKAELDIFCQARACLASADSVGAMTLVTPLASGALDTTAQPPEDTRNWAQLWLDGTILS